MAATYSSLVGLSVGGKYEVRRVLGIGGMGVVCEAVHVDLGKKVAIKLIDKTMKESELIVARFKREWQALGKIQSEHIVDVFDVGADARVGLYMVMEHLAGEDLQTRLDREKRVDLTTGVMLAHQMARGLSKAHAAGVIHRDLKPANVFLTTRDNGSLLVKLLDFGVSKVLGEVGGARITGSGAPIGTPLYMSPEQAEGKDDTDGRADIWSLGAVVYEALAGAPPFADRGSYHGTIVGILTSRAKLLHDAAPWVPAALAKVVDAMLVHDRDARIKDAATVTQRLLEAYPAVLPDGTGRHTAVIVPTRAPVDATGDTEIFTSAGFAEAVRASRPDSEESGRRRDARDDDEDSKRTVPHLSNEATRTAAATPVEMGRSATASAPPSSPRAASGISVVVPKVDPEGPGGPRTDPLPRWGGAASSANGVAMPGTPPVIEPLPLAGDIAPDTQRDTALAMRAERRRWLTLAVAGVVVLAVALGGYLAGRRERSSPTAALPTMPTGIVAPSAPSATPSELPVASTPASTVAAGTTPATTGATATATASTATATNGAVEAPSAAPSTAASVSAPAKNHRRPGRRTAPGPTDATGETKPRDPSPPVVEPPPMTSE